MNVNIITISVEATVEHKRRVHERTGVNQTALFSDLHLLDIKDKASVEDLESQGRFAAKE